MKAAENSVVSFAGQQTLFLEKHAFQCVLDELSDLGFEVIGPRIEQQAIIYDHIQNVDQMPRGWTDEQAPGNYRLKRRNDDSYFGYVVGPHSWKKYLFPPIINLLSSKKTAEGWSIRDIPQEEKRYAFLGVRACELAAIGIQDRVFMNSDSVDPIYKQRRQALFVIAVNCTQAANNCFCTSMKTGPRCKSGFDLAITEIQSGFLIEIGGTQGEEFVRRLPCRIATPEECDCGEQSRQQAVDQISKRMNIEGIREKMLAGLGHPQWDDVANRCLGCANCTLVCPTCFCHSVDEVSDLTSNEVVRQRRWDSCFNFDFSHVSGGPVRDSLRSRYRQWLTHKMATWYDQFGTSGCVGCGRCITWCPVGIDLTQEVAVICGEKE